MNENKLPETLAYYKNANVLLRLALLYAVLWPFGAIIFALYLTPHNAQRMITIFEYSVLIPALLFALRAPFDYFFHAPAPHVKVALRWGAILIAVEFSIGLYCGLVPIANDPALMPVLILAASIIFILSLTKVAHGFVLFLWLVVIGITIVFICGGRPAFKEFNAQVLNPPETVRNSSAVNSPPPAPVPSRMPGVPHAAPPGPIPEAMAPQPASDPIPAPAPPNPFLPDWTQSQRAVAGDFTVEGAPCIIRATNLHCFFRITNQDDQDKDVGVNSYGQQIRIIDDQGKEYLAQTVQIGSRSNTSEVRTTLPGGAPILCSAIFENFTGQSVTLLEIFAYQYGPGSRFDFKIRDIPVTRQGER